MTDRFLKESDIPSLPGGSGGIEVQKLAVNACSDFFGFGTSITAGYLLGSIRETAWAKICGKLGFAGIEGNHAQSASNCFSALRQAYLHLPNSKNRNIGSMVELGFNDFQDGGDLTKQLNKIQGVLRSFLVNSFLEGVVPGNFAGGISKTGTWSDFNSAVHGGKASYLMGSAIKATATGSTLTLDTSDFQSLSPLRDGDTFVIGTYANNGDGSTGGFEVYLNDVLVFTYNPNGRTSSITDITGYDNSITPDVVIIKGCLGKVLKIVSTSNTQTIIDYLGQLSSVDNTAPIFVSLIPRCSAEIFEETFPYRTEEMFAQADEVIKQVVAEFVGYPVVTVDPNKYYDPETQTIDGIHPNLLGNQKIAKSYFEAFNLGVNGSPVPAISSGIKVVTVESTGTKADMEIYEQMVSPTALTAADFSTGSATVTGQIGQISYDDNYKYECVGVNTWKRQVLNTDLLELYLADIDDSGGAKTSVELQAAYPTSKVGQCVWGSLYRYEKKTSTLWFKTAITEA